MIRALLLLVNPIPTWERVVEAKRGMVTILLFSLLPLLVLVLTVEGYGLTRWGKQPGEYGQPVTLPLPFVLRYGAIQLGLSLAVVFVGAFLVKAIGETFHGRHNYRQAFTVVAHGLGPFFLMRVLDALPREPWWLTWVIGILLAASVLYTGLPLVMRPDPAHALGLYFMSILLLAAVTGLASFFGCMFLQQQFSLAANLVPAGVAPGALQ
jgi:hypothetical protein